MIDQHLGRRSVSDFQRGVLALRKKQILAERRAQVLEGAGEPPSAPGAPAQPASADAPWDVAAAATQIIMIGDSRTVASPSPKAKSTNNFIGHGCNTVATENRHDMHTIAINRHRCCTKYGDSVAMLRSMVTKCVEPALNGYWLIAIHHSQSREAINPSALAPKYW